MDGDARSTPRSAPGRGAAPDNARRFRTELIAPLAPALAAAILLVPLPTLAQAQGPGPAADRADGLQILAGGSAGGFWAGEDRLYSWAGPTRVGGFRDVANVTLDPGLAAGLGLRARMPALRLDLGVSVERTLGSGGAVTTSTECVGGCLAIFAPPGPGHPFGFDLTLVAAHLTFRPFPPVWRLRPFVDVGYGVAVYDFETGSVPDSVVAPLPPDADAGTYRLGGGLTLPVRGVEVEARVITYPGGYGAPAGQGTSWQRHVTATLGVLYRVW